MDLQIVKNLLYLIVVLEHAQGECPLGWIHYGDSCYYFSTEKLSWYVAESSCRGHDARLAEVESKQQSDFLIDMAKKLNRPVSYWIGGRDDIIEGTWMWASSDRVFNYTAWGPGEPNGHASQNCLDMYYHWTWRWDDNVCSLQEPFICEKRYPETEEIIG